MENATLLSRFLLILFLAPRIYSNSVPVVLWHGMGDNCCSSQSMGKIKSLIEKEIPGVYVVSVMIGSDPSSDSYNSYFSNVNAQIQQVCASLSSDPKLAGRQINAIGFSQGSQFLRGYVQRCNFPPVKNLISIGGQHEGICGLPHCSGMHSSFCQLSKKFLSMGAYSGWIQKRLVQAQYWHDPLQEKEYAEKSEFLADINNERHLNETYKSNLESLNKFVMVKFTNDTMVVPVESQWFGFYKPGQKTEVEEMSSRSIFTQDRIGLKSLFDSDRISFLSVEGDHLQFSLDWFNSTIVNQFLK